MAHGADASERRLWARAQQLAHEISDAEQYAALLVDGELPTVLAECTELLRAHPDPERVQLIVAILLQMIEVPEQLSVNNNTPRHAQAPPHMQVIEHARDWAVDMLLDIHTSTSSSSGAVPTEPLSESLPMQQLQTSLCTYAALDASSHLVDELQEAIFTSFALQQVRLDDAALAEALDLCAGSVLDDLECALFVDVMLASRDAFTVSRGLLDRLFRSSAVETNGGSASPTEAAPVRASRLFDQLSFVSMVRVWGNHLPTWEAQLQDWLLEAHATPFVPMAAIVWRCQEGVEPENASATLQSYSYLYVVLISWFAKNSAFLASPRSMELLSLLSSCTRLSTDHRSHGRSLVHELGLGGVASESNTDTLRTSARALAFAKAESVLRSLLSSCAKSDDDQNDHRSEIMARHLQCEWMGIAERPHIIQDALELLFATPEECKQLEKHAAAASVKVQESRGGAAALIGWFHAFIESPSDSSSSASSIAALALEMGSSLSVVNLPGGSAWLQQKRAEFQTLTHLRIKIVWFWLLKCCYAATDSIQNDAAVVDALESIEYAFRRFAPAKNKRAFQVEIVAQLLSDLEWRWKTATRQHHSVQQSQLKELQERVDVPLAWLKKVVRLMQVEQTQQQRTPHLPVVHGSALSLSEQLTVRLEHLFGNA